MENQNKTVRSCGKASCGGQRPTSIFVVGSLNFFQHAGVQCLPESPKNLSIASSLGIVQPVPSCLVVFWWAALNKKALHHVSVWEMIS
mmetsp:Transcript_28773/g.54098  ORF Transcript_28773/g.54098 Transcript_28773/m.54098 type:complete len:88 (+) Transcript_28773:1076-1339(+)